MLLLSNFVIIIILFTCAIVGLDKLIASGLFISIIFCSDLFNLILKNIVSDCKLVAKLEALFKNKINKDTITKHLKIIFCFLFFIVWLAIISEVICLASGHGLSVGDSFNSRVFCVWVK